MRLYVYLEHIEPSSQLHFYGRSHSKSPLGPQPFRPVPAGSFHVEHRDIHTLSTIVTHDPSLPVHSDQVIRNDHQTTQR